MPDIKLLNNHLRALSSTMYLIEKMLGEMEEMILSRKKGNTLLDVDYDLSPNDEKKILKDIALFRAEIFHLNEKYMLTKQHIIESHFINSRKTKIWELLHDSNVKRMNAYGKFPESMVKEYEKDLNKLIDLLDKW